MSSQSKKNEPVEAIVSGSNTTDLLDVLTKEVETSEPIPTPEELKFKEIYQKSKITLQSKFDKPKTLLYFKDNQKNKDIPFGSLGNFSLLTGKSKSKKTFFTSIVTASFLNRNGYTLETFRSAVESDKTNLIYFDTEQDSYDCFRVLKRVYTLSGLNEQEFEDRVQFHCLREYAPNERLQFIEQVLKQSSNFGLIVIDGVTDLISSVNDEEQATMVSSNLLKWSSIYKCHITTILHQNKGDENAKGHLGSYLTQKAELVLSMSKECDNISAMKITHSRRLAPEEPFYFAIDEYGIPYKANEFDIPVTKTGTPKKKSIIEDFRPQEFSNLAANIFDEFPNGINRDTLVSKMQIQLERSQWSNEYKTGLNEISKAITFFTDEYNMFKAEGNTKAKKYFLNPNFNL